MSTLRFNTSLRYLRVAIVLLTLVASVDVCGQAPTPTPEPKPNSQPAPTKSSATVSNPTNAQTANPQERITTEAQGKSISVGPTEGDLKIISDTTGVDFGPYMKELRAVLQKHWEPLIPQSALAPMWKSGQVTVEFEILKDGSIRGLQLVKSSGDLALDRAAVGAIFSSSGRFSSLPAAFSKEYVRLHVNFFYNPNAGDKRKAEFPQKPDAKK